LSKKLAELLGGRIELQSQPGEGSTFSLIVPCRYGSAAAQPEAGTPAIDTASAGKSILVIAQEPEAFQHYKTLLSGVASGGVLLARPGDALRQFGTSANIRLVIAHTSRGAEPVLQAAAEVKSTRGEHRLGLIVIGRAEHESRAYAIGADLFATEPMEQQRLLESAHVLSAEETGTTVLVVDDDDVAQYLVRKALADLPVRIIEAKNGREGLRIAHEAMPAAIVLDLVMPEVNGFEALHLLRGDDRTREIPVVIYTSKPLSASERESLASYTVQIVNKNRPGSDLKTAVEAAVRTVPIGGLR
jgi:CheY-like chemotaxis protein